MSDEKRFVVDHRDIIDEWDTFDGCTIDQVIKKFEDIRKKIDNKLHQFEVQSEHDYGDPGTQINLNFLREETDREKIERLEIEKERKQDQDNWDRIQYEKLKKKFEGCEPK